MRKVHAFSLGVVTMLTLTAVPARAQDGAQAAPPNSTALQARALDGARVARPILRRPGLAQRQAADRAGAEFWTALNDTTLDRLLGQALQGSPQLQAAAAQLDNAGAARVQAALDLAPRVTADAGYTRRRLATATYPGFGAGSIPDQDLWNSELSASWDVDLFGRARNALGARSAQVDASGEDLRYTRVTLTADVAATYFALRGAQQQLAVARRNAENQKRTLDLTQARLSAGRGTAFDTERARAQLNTTLAAVPSLEARIASLQHHIGVLLGRDPTELVGELSAQAALPDFPATLPAGDTVDVIRMRPDVLGSEAEVAASQSQVRSARADYLPHVSLAANAGYLANRVHAFGNQGTFDFMIGPVVSWTAFDIGHVKARADQAQAQELAARARHDQVVLQAKEELETANARYTAARERLGYLREASTASEHAADLARMRYEGGVADFLQVLDAQRTLLAAQDQLAQAEAEVADAYVALGRARGAGWPAEEAERH